MAKEKRQRRICYHCGTVIASARAAYRLTGVLVSDADSREEAVEERQPPTAEASSPDPRQRLDILLCEACRTILERDWLTDRRADRADRFLH